MKNFTSILLSLMVALTLVSCTSQPSEDETSYKGERKMLYIIEKQHLSNQIILRVVDQETGMEYFLTSRGQITPRMDENGKPMVNPKYNQSKEKEE